MPYLIDGHNLIPHVTGLSLKTLDDEEQLITLLQAFCRAARTSVEVYFDGAPAGHTGRRSYGNVTAHFIRQGQKADDALATRLRKMGKSAANWILVSSDHWVQAQGRDCRAKVMSSDEFAYMMVDVFARRNSSEKKDGSADRLGEEEIAQWLNLFEQKGPPGKDSSNKPSSSRR